MARRFIVLDAAFVRLVPAEAHVERIAAGFRFTEGPVWRGDHLLFSDIPHSLYLILLNVPGIPVGAANP